MTRKLGKYTQLKLLGEGATSLVYLAKAPHLEKPVAVKIFKQSANALDVEFSTFKSEANIMHTLNGQPNIISIMDVDQLADGRCFIVMPFYERSVADILRQKVAIELPFLISLLEQILTGLMVIHQRQLIHADIKPDNILLDQQNRVFLADFGIARNIQSFGEHSFGENSPSGSQFVNSQMSGTPEYMCPELRNLNSGAQRGKTAGGSNTIKDSALIDIYAAGVVFSKLFAQLNDNLSNPLYESLKEFIARCMAPTASLRPADGASALSDLQALLIASGVNSDSAKTNSDATSSYYQQEQTIQANHQVSLSEETKSVLMMIRGCLINNGALSDKDVQSIIASQEFQRYWQKQTEITNTPELSQVDTIQQLCQSVITQLDQDHPNWQALAKGNIAAGDKHKNSMSLAILSGSFRRKVMYALVFVLIMTGIILVNMLMQDSPFDNTESIFDRLNNSVSNTKIKEDGKSTDEHTVSDAQPASSNTEASQEQSMVTYSQLAFTIEPFDANVLLFDANGVPIAFDRQQPVFLAGGDYKVRVSKNGFTTLNRVFTVSEPQQNLALSLALGNTQYLIEHKTATKLEDISIEFSLIPNSEPLHRFMTTEVTNQLYDACIEQGQCRNNKKHSTDARQQIFDAPNHPAINVSWYDITEQFIPWLSQKTNTELRLPTQAQWLNAASATEVNAAARFSWGDSMRSNKAHCRDCNPGSPRTTVEVASFEPNAYQLFDMHGNVQEWTRDCWQVSSYTQARCDQATIKGGSWLDGKTNVQLNARTYLSKRARSHSTGFRLIEVVDSHE